LPLLSQIEKYFNIAKLSKVETGGIVLACFFKYSHLGGKDMERKESRPAMNFKLGEIFRSSTDGVDFIVKKVVRDMVLLETRDGKRQILTGVRTLTSTSFYLKQGGEELSNRTFETLLERDFRSIH
jgi:hypothetical protein